MDLDICSSILQSVMGSQDVLQVPADDVTEKNAMTSQYQEQRDGNSVKITSVSQDEFDYLSEAVPFALMGIPSATPVGNSGDEPMTSSAYMTSYSNNGDDQAGQEGRQQPQTAPSSQHHENNNLSEFPTSNAQIQIIDDFSSTLQNIENRPEYQKAVAYNNNNDQFITNANVIEQMALNEVTGESDKPTENNTTLTNIGITDKDKPKDLMQKFSAELFDDFIDYISKDAAGKGLLAKLSQKLVDSNITDISMLTSAKHISSHRENEESNSISRESMANNADSSIAYSTIEIGDNSSINRCQDDDVQTKVIHPPMNKNFIVPKYTHYLLENGNSALPKRGRKDDPKNFQCQHCDRSFRTDYYLKNHMRVHSKAHFSKTCEICGMKFKQQRNVNRHVMLVHKMERPWRCESCLRCFESEDSLRTHMGKFHDDHTIRETRGKKPPIVECNICHKTFNAVYFKRVHRFTHKGLRYACGLCGYSCDAEARLKAHFRKHEAPGAFRFRCVKCTLCFRSRIMLERHLEWRHGVDGNSPLVQQLRESLTRFTCQECGQILDSRAKLNLHEAEEHPNLVALATKKDQQKEFEGPEMPREAIEELENAEETEDEKQQDCNPFFCKLCKTGFHTFLQLKYHCDSQHQGVGHSLIMHIPAAPSATVENAVTQASGSNHQAASTKPRVAKAVSSNPVDDDQNVDESSVAYRYRKPRDVPLRVNEIAKQPMKAVRKKCMLFKCQYCDAEFRMKMVLKKHELLHNSNNAKNGQSNALKSTENLSKCAQCGAVFGNHTLLRKHELSHEKQNGEKMVETSELFHCNFPNCSALFKNKTMLVKHVQLHSKQKRTRKRNKKTSESTASKSLTSNKTAKTGKETGGNDGKFRMAAIKHECPHCDAVFRNGNVYLRHLALHSVKSIKLSSEQAQQNDTLQGNNRAEDGKQGKNVVNQKAAVNLVDSNLNKCRFCEAVYKNEGMLQKHESMHKEYKNTQPQIASNERSEKRPNSDTIDSGAIPENDGIVGPPRKRGRPSLSSRNSTTDPINQKTAVNSVNNNLNKCRYCEAVYKDEGMLQKHESMHKEHKNTQPQIASNEGIEKRPYSDTLNTESTPENDGIAEPIRKRGRPSLPRNNSTSDPINQKAAENLVDSNLNKCRYCKAVYKNKGMLQKHESMHMRYKNTRPSLSSRYSTSEVQRCSINPVSTNASFATKPCTVVLNRLSAKDIVGPGLNMRIPAASARAEIPVMQASGSNLNAEAKMPQENPNKKHLSCSDALQNGNLIENGAHKDSNFEPTFPRAKNENLMENNAHRNSNIESLLPRETVLAVNNPNIENLHKETPTVFEKGVNQAFGNQENLPLGSQLVDKRTCENERNGDLPINNEQDNKANFVSKWLDSSVDFGYSRRLIVNGRVSPIKKKRPVVLLRRYDGRHENSYSSRFLSDLRNAEKAFLRKLYN